MIYTVRSYRYSVVFPLSINQEQEFLLTDYQYCNTEFIDKDRKLFTAELSISQYVWAWNWENNLAFKTMYN